MQVAREGYVIRPLLSWLPSVRHHPILQVLVLPRPFIPDDLVIILRPVKGFNAQTPEFLLAALREHSLVDIVNGLVAEPQPVLNDLVGLLLLVVLSGVQLLVGHSYLVEQ